jgi:hypothetical protein
VLACGQRALAHVSYLESTRAKAQLNRDQTDQFYTGNLASFAPGLTEHRLQHAPSLPTASHQPKSGVKNDRARAQIMLRITQTALNQCLRSETVRALSDLTQKPRS